jgi:predicted nucleic acid-binding Zn ribbon protein
VTEDRCVCCGKIVPEGYMVCPDCENHIDTTKQTVKLKWHVRLLKKLGVNVEDE